MHRNKVYCGLIEALNNVTVDVHILDADQINCILDLNERICALEGDLEDLEWEYEELTDKLKEVRKCLKDTTDTHELTKEQITCILDLSDYIVQLENDLEDLEWDHEQLIDELKELKLCLKDTA